MNLGARKQKNCTQQSLSNKDKHGECFHIYYGFVLFTVLWYDRYTNRSFLDPSLSQHDFVWQYKNISERWCYKRDFATGHSGKKLDVVECFLRVDGTFFLHMWPTSTQKHIPRTSPDVNHGDRTLTPLDIPDTSFFASHTTWNLSRQKALCWTTRDRPQWVTITLLCS